MCESCIKTTEKIMAEKPEILELLSAHKDEIMALATKLIPLGKAVSTIIVVVDATKEPHTPIPLDEAPDTIHGYKDLKHAQNMLGLMYGALFYMSNNVEQEFYEGFSPTLMNVLSEAYYNGHAVKFYTDQLTKN